MPDDRYCPALLSIIALLQDSSTYRPALFLLEVPMQFPATYQPVCHLVLDATNKLAKTYKNKHA